MPDGGRRMTTVSDLGTPCCLLDLDILERNLADMAALCQGNGKKLYPMVKTHKSAYIAARQAAHGADGFLAGTLDEAEMLAANGHREIMLAYPVVGAMNMDRVVELTRLAHITLSFDGVEAAALWEDRLEAADLTLDYLLIIDCGLHRFGVPPTMVTGLARDMERFRRLNFRGIATHPGQVYGCQTPDEVAAVAAEEAAALKLAYDLLTAAGMAMEHVATGSTPTAQWAARQPYITTLRPGNYVFNDAIQTALDVAPAEMCALTVLASVVAHPAGDRYIMDAGSKSLGLDKGAHGAALLRGYGVIQGHPEVWIEGLSEEVGKLRATAPTSLQVGERVRIIPNHACAAANMTGFYVGHRQGVVDRLITVDARGGNRAPFLA